MRFLIIIGFIYINLFSMEIDLRDFKNNKGVVFVEINNYEDRLDGDYIKLPQSFLKEKNYISYRIIDLNDKRSHYIFKLDFVPDDYYKIKKIDILYNLLFKSFEKKYAKEVIRKVKNKYIISKEIKNIFLRKMRNDIYFVEYMFETDFIKLYEKELNIIQQLFLKEIKYKLKKIKINFNKLDYVPKKVSFKIINNNDQIIHSEENVSINDIKYSYGYKLIIVYTINNKEYMEYYKKTVGIPLKLNIKKSKDNMINYLMDTVVSYCNNKEYKEDRIEECNNLMSLTKEETYYLLKNKKFPKKFKTIEEKIKYLKKTLEGHL